MAFGAVRPGNFKKPQGTGASGFDAVPGGNVVNGAGHAWGACVRHGSRNLTVRACPTSANERPLGSDTGSQTKVVDRCGYIASCYESIDLLFEVFVMVRRPAVLSGVPLHEIGIYK
jgi:hypothetical protein